MREHLLKRRGGFTLIELLIVVVIIGILAAIAIPKFGQTREKAYFSAMQSDLRNLSTQQEIYYSENSYNYADDISNLDFNESEGVTVSIEAATTDGWWAQATHAAVSSGEGCAIAVGDTTLTPTTPAGTEIPDSLYGTVVCD